MLTMHITRAKRKADRLFYPVLTLLISMTGFAGFSFTYFGPMLNGSYPVSPFILHLHGWSFFLWYLLFPLQAMLVAGRKIALHKKLGWLSLAVVIFMTLTGLFVLSARVEETVRVGEPQLWLMYGPLVLSNLLLFDLFYAASVYMVIKKQFQAHKRLMIVASAIGLGAGFFRLILFLSNFHPLSLPIGVLSCSLFILIGIIYDRLLHKSAHPVYWIGLAVMLIVEITLLPQVNEDLVALITHGLATLGEPFNSH